MRVARPWLGLILGVLLGLMIAILIQQEGIWPLDQLLVFGLVGLFGLFGSWLGRIGRDAVSAFSMIVPLILAVALVVFGAIGAAAAGEKGELNGPCMVNSQTSVPDTTDVKDTSKGDAYKIDPDGSLSWQAVSSPPIVDHHWEIWVEFGGFSIPIESGSHPNEGMSPGNSDQINDLTAYVQQVTSVSGQEIRGVFKVGGFIATGTSVICDGFGFVVLTTDGPLESLISKIALGLAVLFLVLLLMLFFRRHGGEDLDFGGGDTGDRGFDDLSGPAGAAGSGGTAAATIGDDEPNEDLAGKDSDTDAN